MSRQDPKNFSTFYSSKRSNQFRPTTSGSPAMLEGRKPKTFGEGKKKQTAKPVIYTNEFHELALQEKDERFRYLLKNGDLMRIEKGGNIIFSELPQIPNIWVCYRRPIERENNPDKLNLDSIELTHMPLLEGEEKLKMLTYQHNNISKIQNLISLPNVIYIDLYDNSIKEIENLESAKNMKVLLLAKNSISRIKNLSDMTKLEVLDLHGNKISKIEGLSNLGALKILNLSYNSIFKIENLDHVTQLTELNLKSNKINSIEHIRHLTHLQKLYLANNKIQIKTPDTCQLTKLHSLKQFTIEDNPCANKEEFFIVQAHMGSLKTMDGKPTNKNDKEKSKEKQMNLNTNSKEEEEYDHSDVLKLIIKQWEEEKERVAQLEKTNSLKKDLLKNSCITGGHAEIEDETVLFIFGNSYEAVLSDSRYYQTVEKIKFQYVLFEFIIESSILNMLRKFKKLRAIEFKRNNITSLLQVAKLEALPGLRVINIDKEDNPVFHCSFLKQFIVYRFPTVAVINRLDVKEGDRSRAKSLFHNFDRMLQIPQKFFNPENLRQFPCEDINAKKDKNYLKMYNKYISDISESEVKEVCERVLKSQQTKREFEAIYDQTILQMISQLTLQ